MDHCCNVIIYRHRSWISRRTSWRRRVGRKHQPASTTGEQTALQKAPELCTAFVVGSKPERLRSPNENCCPMRILGRWSGLRRAASPQFRGHFGGSPDQVDHRCHVLRQCLTDQ